MDARMTRVAVMAAAFLSLGASYRTQNFVVTASSPQFAQQVATQAEAYRRDLAVEWLGKPLPAWREPCPIRVEDSPRLGAGGATSFMFDSSGTPFQWRMSIQGSQQAILDSVLPHEVTHTIFATHFGRPLPRWADEGACTTVESNRERRKQDQMLIEFLTNNRGIPFNTMFRLTEYPRDIMPLYSQGYSVAQFLIAQGGKQKFIRYVGAGMQSSNWDHTTKEFYGFNDLSELQLTWVDWIRKGRPAPQARNPVALAAAEVADREPSEVEATLASLTTSETAPAQPPARLASVATSEPSQPGYAPTVSSEGWYAKQARLAAAGQQAPAARNASVAPVGHDRGPEARDVEQSVTRPQGYERPQQRILQATSPAPPADFPAIRHADAQPQRGYSSLPSDGTIRR